MTQPRRVAQPRAPLTDGELAAAVARLLNEPACALCAGCPALPGRDLCAACTLAAVFPRAGAASGPAGTVTP